MFISVAEPSADQHAARLIRACRAIRPSVRFVGVAGPNMVAAGCWPIFDMTRHSAMLLGILGSVGRAAAMMTTCERHLRRYPFDAAVLLDSPTLHLPLAARAKAAGVPVFYYIAPQMWAWGAYRITKLRHRTDQVGVILPFEEQYFRDQGIDATYVGHPLADVLAEEEIDEAVVAEIRRRGRPVIALLPGSRKHVVEEVLPGQLEVSEEISRNIRGATFGVSVAGDHLLASIQDRTSHSSADVRLYPGSHAELIRAADLVLVASGTTTLEVAFAGKAMIVMYNASRLFYNLIGRRMIHTKYLSLPNILAGREVVPEFMPYYRSTAPIAERAIELLHDDTVRSRMEEDLRNVVEPLRAPGTARRVARMVLDMAADRG